MVVKTEVSSRHRAPIGEECYSELPHKFLEELQSLELHYPGWHKDVNATREWFEKGAEADFMKSFRKLKEKQRVYDDYKAHMRLNALAAVELVYPGHEFDKQAVEQWHLQHPSNDETDMIFQDKLEGLRNKDKLFNGDRSHPNIQDLDKLDLSYPEWEEDYQAAVAAHCDTPAKSFANKLHRLRQKQAVYDGSRAHWRLVQLDKLNLTYPGWETDFAQVEEWHFNNADSTKNDNLYAEVIEGMKDQQQIYLGWDHDEEEEEEEESEEEDESVSEGYATSVGSSGSPTSSVEKEKAKMKEMVELYASIADNISSMEGKKKKLMEERSTCSSNPASSRNTSPAPRERSNGRDQPPRAKTPGTMTVSVPKMFPMKLEETVPRPPKQVTLGKCEVCLIRKKTHVFVPCGHLCACAACSHKAMEETGSCPICRNQSENSFRVFLT